MATAAPSVRLAVPPVQQEGGVLPWLRTHRPDVVMACLLAFAGPLTFFAGALSVMRLPSATNVAWLALWWSLYGASLWCLLLVAGFGVERVERGFGRFVRGAIGLLAAGSAAALTNALTAGRAAILIEQGLVHSAETMHLHSFTYSLVMALIFLAHLHHSREHAMAAARLVAAQTSQREVQHRLARARLQEMQARIDPRLLFEMLGTVRRLYERDAERAEPFLDELIVFLRAALPRRRSVAPSLLREVELARAFASLRSLADAGGQGMTVDVSPDALHARFPPGVLLPLLHAAESSAAPCRLTATRRAGGLRLVLALAAAPSAPAVQHVRSLLTDLHGTAASVEVDRSAGTSLIIVEVPYELA